MAKAQENKRVRNAPSRKAQSSGRKTPAPVAKSNGKATSPSPGKSRKSKGKSTSDSDSTDGPKAVEELLFPGGIETLLPCKSRKPLPQLMQRRGRKELLVEIVTHAPEIYQNLISQIQAGVSFNIAAECAGIAERTFFLWGWKGKTDADSNVDSYYARFYRDVRRAAATQAARCERDIALNSPAKWLTHGPGRIFGNPWAKDKSGKALQQTNSSHGSPALPAPTDDAVEATFTVLPNQQDIIDDENESDETQSSSQGQGQKQLTGPKALEAMATLALSPEQDFAALQVLESIGMLTISDALKAAYASQAKEEEAESITKQ